MLTITLNDIENVDDLQPFPTLNANEQQNLTDEMKVAYYENTNSTTLSPVQNLKDYT